mgnify:FL=1
MQVLFEDGEYEQLQGAARRQGLTLAEWVRQALRAAVRGQPADTAGRKLAVVRAATRHAFPTADIDRMLAEIERGYGA